MTARRYSISHEGESWEAVGRFSQHTGEDGVTTPAIDTDAGLVELPAAATVRDLDSRVALWPPSAYLAELVDVVAELETPVYDSEGGLLRIDRETTFALVPRPLLEREPRDPDAPPVGFD